jgi:hypothetical protein
MLVIFALCLPLGRRNIQVKSTTSGMWCHVLGSNFTEVLEECTASMFRVEECVQQVTSKKKWMWCVPPNCQGTSTILKGVTTQKTVLFIPTATTTSNPTNMIVPGCHFQCRCVMDCVTCHPPPQTQILSIRKERKREKKKTSVWLMGTNVSEEPDYLQLHSRTLLKLEATGT